MRDINVQYRTFTDKKLIDIFIDAVADRCASCDRFMPVRHDKGVAIRMSDIPHLHGSAICYIDCNGNLRLPTSISLRSSRYLNEFKIIKKALEYIGIDISNPLPQYGDGAITAYTEFHGINYKKLPATIKRISAYCVITSLHE